MAFKDVLNKLAGLFPSSARNSSTLRNPDGWLLDEFTHANDSGVRVTESSALAHMAFYRCVTLLAGSIATQPKHLYRRTGSRLKNKDIDREHPAYRLIKRRPNAYQNSYQFHFNLVVRLLMYGNFYAHISRDRYYRPIALHPIEPWRVRPKLEDKRKVFYIDGDRYTNSEILHVYGLSLDNVKGINPIKYASQSIGLGLAAEKMQSSAFGKGLHAGGILQMPEDMKGKIQTNFSTDEEAEEYMSKVRESFRKAYQNGPESWHNMMFLEPGWEFEQFQLNLETAQIIETRKMGIADIARLMGVPLHKVMELDKATKDNIEQQGIEYVQDGVMPITVNIESEFDDKLLRLDQTDRFFKFNLDGLMRADLKSRYEAYSIALGKNAPGFMSPGEIRDLEDLGEINRDDLFKPDNMNKQTYQPKDN